MRRKRFSRLKRTALVALAVLAGSTVLAAPAEASPAAPMVRSGSVAGLAWKSYTWTQDQHAGDCTLFGGATWTLYSDGTARFEGTVTSSDDDDAWLMSADILTANGSWLDRLVNTVPDTWDTLSFVKNLPDHRQQYHWTGYGKFPVENPNYFPSVGSMSMTRHC
jgi:hypothetical protein